MRRFVFKLEGVLDQRRQAEHQRQRDVAQAQRQIMLLETAIGQAEETNEQSTVRLRGRLDPRTLAVHVRFGQVMQRKLSSLREQLDATRRDLTVAHAAMIEAAKQRKVLEKLEEKQRAAWVAQQEKQESLALDDLAQRSARGPNESSENFPPISP